MYESQQAANGSTDQMLFTFKFLGDFSSLYIFSIVMKSIIHLYTVQDDRIVSRPTTKNKLKLIVKKKPYGKDVLYTALV